jgi:hypothetical protein
MRRGNLVNLCRANVNKDIKEFLLGVSWNTVLDFLAPYLFFYLHHFQYRRIFYFTHHKQTVSAANIIQ